MGLDPSGKIRWRGAASRISEPIRSQKRLHQMIKGETEDSSSEGSALDA
ncbi:hypothetical protein [Cupriavidus alkaliphilus]|nr:hypothetical protein [Cupriavidus alkaliphilus]MBB3015790.1 hypothetical protein [Cupriavidus alkaliphilus]